MNHDFESAHRAWLAARLREIPSRRRAAVEKRHALGAAAFLKDIWWPLAGSLEYVYPQVASADFEGKTRILDLAYARPPFRLGIAIGSGLSAEGGRALPEYWIVLRFSRAELERDPEACRNVVRNALERLYGAQAPAGAELTPGEKEIARLAARSPRPITPADVAGALLVCDKTARAALKSLVDKRVLRAAGGGAQRIRSYAPALEPHRLLCMLG